MITFIDREQELRSLEERHASGKFECIPLYGRRRVGKTELILQFIKNKKAIYFLATSGTKKENIERFKAATKPVIDLSLLKDDWETIFEYIKRNLKGRAIIVLDEFPYLIETEKGLSSIFQAIIDLHLKDSGIFLIISGSSLGMMYKEVLSYRAPLYGRRTGQIHLHPMRFKDVTKFFDKPFKEIVEIYAVCGGVPAYLNEFREKKPIFRLIEEKILKRDSILREEVQFLLREELREPKVYMAILSSLSLGHRRLGKIINYCGFSSKTGITPYLRTLDSLGYIKREVPITESQRSKKGLYFLNDNFFNFWLRFVRANLDIIEQDPKEGIAEIKKEFNGHVGFIFEDVCRQFLWEIREDLPFDFNKLGRWWHRDKEIDLLALGDKKVMFVECKWQDRVDGKKLLQELKEKAKSVTWENEKRKEHFCIIAKSFATKDEDAIFFDLKDMEKAFSQGSKTPAA